MSEDAALQDAMAAEESEGKGLKYHFLNFFQKLQALSNKIHSTRNLDEIMLDLSPDICELFGCERLTMYAVTQSRMSIESKVKTGLTTFKNFKLPISDKSIAGYVALYKKMVNLQDVYDDKELHLYSPKMQFMQKVDDRTGFKTRAMLVHPIVNAQTGELLGVLQLINNKLDDAPFSVLAEEGANELCKTLAVAFAHRIDAPPVIRTKYDFLVTDKVLSVPEMELAVRAAKRKQLDLEEVLINEFKVPLADLGHALSQFFDVPYTPYSPLRDKPADLLKNFKREYVENNEWLLLEQKPEGLVVLTIDPDRTEGSRIVHNLFPKTDIAFRVTTRHEFRMTLDQFFGQAEVAEEATAEEKADNADEHAAAIEEALLKRVEKAIHDAFQQSAYDIRLEVVQVQDKSKNVVRPDGSLDSLSGQCVIDFRIDFP